MVVTLIVPAFVTGRASKKGTPVMVSVVPFGIDSAPLPPTVPPVQVIAAAVRLMAALPFSVPPCIVSAGIVCVAALLSVSVPPFINRFVESVPLKVFVPLLTWNVPAPVTDEAASNDDAVE